MRLPLKEILESYQPDAALVDAFGPPAEWYIDDRVFELERSSVFTQSWQMAGRADQVRDPGQFITFELAGEPIFVVRGDDGIPRSFFNICRHKGAALLTHAAGQTTVVRCPYHGWSYTLDGKLKGAPEFQGVRNFDAARNGLIEIQATEWQQWVFVKLAPGGPSLEDFWGADLVRQIQGLGVDGLHWAERRHYTIDCNWKVFIDNYLDGGYHVPRLHQGLSSVLDYGRYTVENGERHCIQSSPMVAGESDLETAAVRQGERALYVWIYPNFMINAYQGLMDTNLVWPRGVDRTEVIFDFYFGDISDASRERNRASIAVSERIQNEDLAICESVQRGMNSRAYRPGRLSVRRERGEHLFHRLLHHDLMQAWKSADQR